MSGAAAQFEPSFFFLPGSRGKLFAALRRPVRREAWRGAVLCVVPMAEEMNRCRRLLAVQSCELAARGIGVLCIDPYGCGDSEGEFSDADWETWSADLRLAHDWLERESGRGVDVWAIRHGALLAAGALNGEARRRVILWQPVLRGSAALSEMLRVSVAGNMLNAGESPVTTGALRAELLGGKTIDVGGYPLNPRLARSLEAASLEPWPLDGSRVDWLEMVPEPGSAPSANGTAVADAWRARGVEVRLRAVPGRRFWSSPDVVECDELVRATLEAFGSDA